jgi:hypothetical protein
MRLNVRPACETLDALKADSTRRPGRGSSSWRRRGKLAGFHADAGTSLMVTQGKEALWQKSIILRTWF